MILKGKNILLISPEPWDHIFVSKHHYAIHLTRRENLVYFLNPPCESPLRVSETEFDSVYTIDYNGFIKGLRYLPGVLRKYFELLMFRRLERICGLKFDIVWAFDNSVFYDLDALPDRTLKICHTVDLNQNFNIDRAASSADCCFGSSRYITDVLSVFNRNVYFINHGFNKVKPEDLSLSAHPGKNNIKCLYAGNLNSKYLDWSTLNKVIKENRNIDFLFAGNIRNSDNLQGANIFYLNKLNAAELQSAYDKADVLLLCYKADEFPEQLSNPHKMMEYIGSGKVIIATKTVEYEHLAESNLIAMSNKNAEYPTLFKRVIDEIDVWNSTDKMTARMDYAYDNTYEKQLHRIEKILSKIEIDKSE